MKTIFSDPINWAYKCAGTQGKYRLMQFLTIFIGVLVLTLLFLLVKRNEFFDKIFLVILVLIFLIEMPLLYLKAIRSLLIKRQKLFKERGENPKNK